MWSSQHGHERQIHGPKTTRALAPRGNGFARDSKASKTESGEERGCIRTSGWAGVVAAGRTNPWRGGLGRERECAAPPFVNI
jgi:hypothetical protein